MKNLLILAILFFATLVQAQDARTILKKSYEKCRSIEQGYYEMESNFKWYNNPKVDKRYFRTYFKKDKSDPIYSFYFKNEKDYFDTLASIEVYNGDTQILAFTYANKGTIMSSKENRKDIISYKHNLIFFNPLLYKDNYPLNYYKNKNYQLTFLKIDYINNIECFNIKINEINNPEKEELRNLKHELMFWIDTTTYLPVLYTEEFVSLMGKDTQTQFEKVTLHKLETDIVIHDSIFSIKSIPDSFELKNYEPYKRPELLKNGTIFPDFTYVNLKGDSIQLSSLKGKVVLIDFFYKSCYPCILALPHIQELHEKYKDQGLVVVGIDPFDKREILEPFLQTQGITYEALLGNGKEIRDNYHVSGYPCVYILNKNGEVVLAKTGYGPGMEKKYKKSIKKALKQN